MKSVRFVFLFTALTSALLSAQTDSILAGQNLKVQLHPIHGARLVSQSPNSKGHARPLRSEPTSQGLNFAPPVSYGSGGFDATAVAVADLNGDGKPDVVVVNECVTNTGCPNNGEIGVLLGNGDGTFATAATYSTGDIGALAFGVAVADLNRDGHPDVVVVNSDGTVSVLLGQGDGTLQPAMMYSGGGEDGQGVAIADVNGDGFPDLIVARCAFNGPFGCGDVEGGIGVLLGNGDGTFQTAMSFPSGAVGAKAVAVADFNRDGKPDLVVANLCISSCEGDSDGAVSLLLGNGDGTFQSPATYPSGGTEADSIAAGDMNGDGSPDVAVGNQDGGLGVLLNDGSGLLLPVVVYNPGGSPPSAEGVMDVNGDGKPDIVVSNVCGNQDCSDGAAGVLLGNGDGTFQQVTTFSSGGFAAQWVAVADVNGDGKADVVLANECVSASNCMNGSVGVLINTSVVPTVTMLVSSVNPSSMGQAVTFTATVTPQFGSGAAGGAVSFYDGGMIIGNAQLSVAGTAFMTTSLLTIGTHRIMAEYNGNAQFGSSQSPILYQVVVPGAVASFSPPNLDFGNETVGITSRPQNVVLKNSGDVGLMIGSIQINGSDANDFSEFNNCPALLAPSGSCTIMVTFTPKAAGMRNAAVNVTDNAAGSPQSIPLTGIGVSAGVRFSPPELNFPVQLVFTSSAQKEVRLTNTGRGFLEISARRVSGPFGMSTDCTDVVSPGASCTIKVRFEPTTKGLQEGSIVIIDNAPGSPQKVSLFGTGTFVELTPSSLNFGDEPVDRKSRPKTITLTNKGNGPVKFKGRGVSIRGKDRRDFDEHDDCHGRVGAGGSCSIRVTFTPMKLGPRTAEVSVSDDGGGSPQVVPLSGTGTR
jgi:hypothetical protein